MSNFRFGCIAYSQDFQFEYDFPATQRIIAIDEDNVLGYASHSESLGLPLVVLHQDGGADLAVFFRDIVNVFGDNQGFIPGAVQLVAVDRNFDGVAGRLAFEFIHDLGCKHRIHAMHIAKRVFHLGEHAIGLDIDDLVFQLDVLAISDDCL